jgi:hypothetical protein
LSLKLKLEKGEVKGDTDEEIGRDKRGRRDGQTMVEKDISESNVMGSGLASAGFQHRRPQ